MRRQPIHWRGRLRGSRPRSEDKFEEFRETSPAAPTVFVEALGWAAYFPGSLFFAADFLVPVFFVTSEGAVFVAADACD